jgi:hypothetical protein
VETSGARLPVAPPPRSEKATDSMITLDSALEESSREVLGSREIFQKLFESESDAKPLFLYFFGAISL